MTARRRRRAWTAAEMAAALAIADERGIAAAETETGIPSGTLRSRIARARKTPDAVEVGAPAAVTLLAELEREQREALEDLRRARRERKPTVGPATAHAIAVDKLTKERSAERERGVLFGEGLEARVRRIAALRDELRARAAATPPTSTKPSPPVAPVVVPDPVEVEAPEPVEPEREVVPEPEGAPVVVVPADPEPEAAPEPEADVAPEPEAAAEVVPIRRARQWPGRSVQQQFLAAHREQGVNVDPDDFKGA